MAIPPSRSARSRSPQRRNSFQSFRYVSDAVCAAVQMFDLTRVLLILARPEHSRQERAARFMAQAELATR